MAILNIRTYRLIKQLPDGFQKAMVGQEYRNYDYCSSYHFPKPYNGTDIEIFGKWGREGILTKLVDNNPEYFEKIGEYDMTYNKMESDIEYGKRGWIIENIRNWFK